MCFEELLSPSHMKRQRRGILCCEKTSSIIARLQSISIYICNRKKTKIATPFCAKYSALVDLPASLQVKSLVHRGRRCCRVRMRKCMTFFVILPDAQRNHNNGLDVTHRCPPFQLSKSLLKTPFAPQPFLCSRKSELREEREKTEGG